MSEESEGTTLYTSSVVEEEDDEDGSSQSGSEGETDHENLLAAAAEDEQFPYSSLDKAIDKESAAIDWNEEFQKLLEKPTTTPEEVRERNEQIEALSAKFIEMAKPIVETIVLERHVHPSQKTIRPADIGGVAGGSKFIYQNLFFKFSKDTREGMYGGDEWAMKAAGHELKSLNKLISCYIPKVHFPLMALINYLGWRVIVISLLPIHAKTLVYGSADGARTIYNTSETMNDIMAQVGQKLNLKEHVVKDVSIFGPADIEGHKGEDGRYYIADVSRLFPPAFLRHRPQRCHGSIWFRLLRAEFVEKYSKPLSSDAFSAMGVIKKEINNQEILDATSYLENTCVPQFAKEFEKWFESLSDKSHIDIKAKMHEYGINCRYMFVALRHMSNPELKRIMGVEIVARVVRKLLWAEMRRLSSKKLIDKAILNFFNLLFGSGEKSVTFWKTTLVEAINKRFILASGNDEYKRNVEFLEKVVLILDTNEDKLLLLRRIEHLVGVSVYFIENNPDPYAWLSRIPLSHTDVVISLSATTKSIRVLPYTQTYQKVEDAIDFYKHELKARLELLGPSHIQVANIRDHLALLYSVKGKDYFKKAEKQFLKALEIKENYYKNGEEVATYLDQISQFYLQFGEYSKSESLLKRSLEIKKKALGSEHPSIAKTLDQLAQVYRKQGQYAEAKPLFEQALKIYEKVLGTEDPALATTLSNFALLYRQQSKYELAEPLYHRALAIMEATKGSNHSRVSKILSNLAQLYQLQGRYEEAEPLFERCIKIKKKELGPYHLDTATTMNQLAQLYQHQMKYAEAATLYKDALSIREKVLGHDHYSVGKILDKLAELERELQHYEESDRYYAKALTILEKTLGVNHPYFKTVHQKFEEFKKETASGLSMKKDT